MRRGFRIWTAVAVAPLLLGAVWVAPAPADTPNPAAPWDGNPITAGLGPTYGEQWCAAPTPGTSEANQQGAPLAIMPGAAIGCTLEGFKAEAAAAGVPRRMATEVLGKSAQGRDLYGVLVNATETPEQRRDFQRWVQLRSQLLTDPARAQSLLAKWGQDVKLPIVVEANIHGNEEEGTDAIMQVLRDLVTTPRGTNPILDDLLDHSFLIVHPSINPDGRYLGTRFNANGFDMNRDLLVQGQPEVRTSITNMLKWLPPVGLTMHGYTNMIQSMTKPHNPGYEYDLILNWNQRRVDATEAALTAIGMDPIRQVNDWNAMAETSPPPVGPAYAEGWDDWGPFYTAGHASTWSVDIQTIEMCDEGPGCDGRFGSKRMQYVGFYSSARFWLENRNGLLRDQAEIFRRGSTDADRVNCCDDPFVAARGFTEEQHNWMVEYPAAYVIPFDGRAGTTTQRSDAEANRLAQWLLDNGVEVQRLTKATTWRSTTYPIGSYVVAMDQPFRGLAMTTLGAGQDISDRIARLYAPPGAWSKGLLGGADVVEIPRGDTAFRPKTAPVRRVNTLAGGVQPGRADWYAVSLRGQSETRAVLGVLRQGVDASLATAGFRTADGTAMPAGSVVFGDDARTVAALRKAGKTAGVVAVRGRGPRPAHEAVDGVPRIAVLVNSAAPAMNDTLWSLQQVFGPDAEFVSVTAGAGSLQNAPADPLLDYDVIYNAGQNYPAATSGVARERLQAFFARGGGYIGTSQSANNFTFLNDSGLLTGPLTQGSQAAGGGIAAWTNSGTGGPITSAFSAQDYLYLPTNVTYFTAVPPGSTVDGRYLGSTDDLFVAGLWRDRQTAAANAPVVVHGPTTAGSRYVAYATNPFSRGDAERSWPLIAQAALWTSTG
jgi:zinc carboxypeptidase